MHLKKTVQTEIYRDAFILPERSTKTTCLICTEKVIVVIKCGNITCHYKSSNHKQIYPQNMKVIKTVPLI